MHGKCNKSCSGMWGPIGSGGDWGKLNTHGIVKGPPLLSSQCGSSRCARMWGWCWKICHFPFPEKLETKAFKLEIPFFFNVDNSFINF